MQNQQPPKPLTAREARQMYFSFLGVLLFLAMTTAVLLHRRFGHRAISVTQFVVGSLAYYIIHDLVVELGHYRQPDFMHSISNPFFIAVWSLAVYRAVEAYIEHRRHPGSRYSYFMGEPYWSLLPIPMTLAYLLDVASVFAAGWWLRQYDIVLGTWLMFAAAVTLATFAEGVKLRRQNTADLLDAQIYSGVIHERTAPPVKAAAEPETQDLPTGI